MENSLGDPSAFSVYVPQSRQEGKMRVGQKGPCHGHSLILTFLQNFSRWPQVVLEHCLSKSSQGGLLQDCFLPSASILPCTGSGSKQQNLSWQYTNGICPLSWLWHNTPPLHFLGPRDCPHNPGHRTHSDFFLISRSALNDSTSPTPDPPLTGGKSFLSTDKK